MGDRQVCAFWQKGICRFGNRCRDLHGPAPGNSRGNNNFRNQNNNVDPFASGNNNFNTNNPFGNNSRGGGAQGSRNPFGTQQQNNNWNNNNNQNFNNNFNNNNRGGGGGGRGGNSNRGRGGGGNNWNNNNNNANNRFSVLNANQGDPFAAPSGGNFNQPSANWNSGGGGGGGFFNTNQNPNPMGGGNRPGPFRSHPPAAFSGGGDPFAAPAAPFSSHGGMDVADVRMSGGGVHVADPLQFRESQAGVLFQNTGATAFASPQSVFGRPVGSAFSNFPPAQQQQYLHPSQPGIIAGPNTYVPPPVALNIQLPASDEAAAAQTRSASSATTASAADLEAFRAPAFAFGKIPEVEPPPEFRA